MAGSLNTDEITGPTARFHYAWVVLAVTFFSLLIVATIRSEPGIILTSLEQEFSWSRHSITLALSVNLVLFGLAGPFLGRVMDVYGPRVVSISSVILILFGVSGTLFIRESWHLLAFWGVVVGLGSGGMSMVLASTVINRWFEQRRGLALGIAGAAMSAGQLVFTPLLMRVNLDFSWRASVTLIALMLGIIVLPALIVFMRNKPDDLALKPYGQSQVGILGETNKNEPSPEFFNNRNFWLLAFSFAICGLTTSGLFQTHLIPHGVENGFSEMTMALALGLMGATDIFGTIASGWICDIFGKRIPLMIYYLVRGLTLICLPFIDSVTGLMIFSIVYGLNWLSTVPATSALTADIFGKENIGMVFGWIFFAHQLGAAIAVYGAGFLYGLYGDYQIAFMTAGGFAIIASGLVMNIKLNA